MSDRDTVPATYQCTVVDCHERAVQGHVCVEHERWLA